MIRTYEELIKLKTFDERLNYCMCSGTVGEALFGYERYLNQQFYHSPAWRRIRRMVILRDQGRDLACEGHDILGRIIIHHLNPITKYDLVNQTDFLTNMSYLICVSHNTHEAITFQSPDLAKEVTFERKPNDTIPWR